MTEIAAETVRNWPKLPNRSAAETENPIKGFGSAGGGV